MLNAEFVQAIGDLAVKGKVPRVVTSEKEPAGVYFLQDADGKLNKVEATPAYRAHVARDLSAVVEFGKRFMAATGGPLPVIWYDRSAVVCIVNDDNRRDTVTLPLGLSAQVVMLQQWEKSTPFLAQSQAVLTLRTIFDGCLSSALNLIEILRKVKFRTETSGAGEIQHGKSSVGKAIEAEITGAGAIPEYVTFDVPVFANALAHRGMVRCAVEPNPGSASIAFIPIPGEIEKAVATAEGQIRDDLGELLGDAGVPVYYGKP